MDFEIIITYIDEHLHDEISLVELGNLIGYSPWHIYKLFKFYKGEPLMTYIRKRRLNVAAQEIQSNKKILDVALDSGFETAAGFYKAFLKQFNCSPSEYKRIISNVRTKTASNDVTEIIYENGVIEMGKIIIRQLQASDDVSLHENIYVRNTLVEVNERVNNNLEMAKSGNMVQVVSIVDNNIVGTLTLMKETHPLVLHCATLVDEVINPAFNGMGIPDLLLKEVIKFGKNLGIKIIKGS